MYHFLTKKAIGVKNKIDAADASGIHNVFRYLFDVPTGAFTNPPLLAISIDASGNPVIHTPPLNPSATGFDISILASDTPVAVAQQRDPPGVVAYPLDPSGETTIPKTSAPARFFRLLAFPHIELLPIDAGGVGDIVAPHN